MVLVSSNYCHGFVLTIIAILLLLLLLFLLAAAASLSLPYLAAIFVLI